MEFHSCLWLRIEMLFILTLLQSQDLNFPASGNAPPKHALPLQEKWR